MRLSQALGLLNTKRLPVKMERLALYTHVSENQIQTIKEIRRKK